MKASCAVAPILLAGAVALAACAASDPEADDDGAGGAGGSSVTASNSQASSTTGGVGSSSSGFSASSGASSSSSSSSAASSSSGGEPPPVGVLFDLRSTEPYEEGTIAELEAASFTITREGVSATFTASQGVLNQTGSSFGVNSDGAADQSALLDGGAGVELITITFSVDVEVLSVGVSSFGGTDEGSAVVAGGAPITLGKSGDNDLGGGLATTTDSVVVSYVAGNGFSFDRIRVHPVE